MTTPERQERCERCRFWERMSEGNLYPDEAGYCMDEDGTVTIGVCRRYPPQVDHIELYRLKQEWMKEKGFANDGWLNIHRHGASLSPMTSDSEWCGEFSPSPSPS